MEPKQLTNILEALLFVAEKPMRAKDFAKILELPEPEISAALETLAKRRRDSGIVLLENNGQYQLSTNSSYSAQVKNFLNMELREKLTDATVEVLAIIAYRQPISKAEIEAIRGVNSQYSLRHLLMRGLAERILNPHDARSFLYQTSTEFLMNLGLQSVAELPEFEKLVQQIKLPQTPGLAMETGAASEAAAPDETTVTVQQPATAAAPVEPNDETQKEEGFEDEDDGDDK